LTSPLKPGLSSSTVRRATTGQLALTPNGQQARDRLVAARREGLADLLKGWFPEQQAELAELLGRLTRRFLGDDRSDRALAAAPPAPTAQRD
jgi:hypothetical protein